jgi:hypothetical protein
MGMVGRLAAARAGASFVIVAALACSSAALVIGSQVTVKSVSKAGVEISAAIPSLGPLMVSIEDDDRDFQYDAEPCGLRAVRLASPPAVTLSQITPPQSIYISLVTLAQHPLRC